ncbi:pectinesterase-like [Zingiber officinale]|uniref:pectinesterase-like n=1 Tax=Zingiber officinale TaxID=94328 RepID=UPI001C4B4F7F|nr:pectinesterase-like [Zingiber officinale]
MLSKGAALLFVVCSVIPLAVAAAVSPAAACRSSFYPKLCVAMLSPLRSRTSSQYEYGKYSVRQALRQVRRTAALLDGYLAGRLGGAKAHRGVGGGGALGDCRELAGLSAEYLAEAQAELGRRAARPDAAAAGRVRALMSAVVTNQQTCYDGLLASRDGSFPELQGSLANGTQLYGVSLGLVNTALGRSSAAGNAGPSSSGGQTSPPPVASPSTSGRSLVEELSQMVPVKLSQSGLRVAQDGTGDFTSISDAVAFAPNDTAAATAGYFVVYISEGIYHENVVVPMNKRNLILIGAGINRTVITSNHSVGDGWTTFNSATFAVNGERFIAVGITFENTAGAAKYQAVAVRNSADLTIFYRCSFLGYQDTLYVHTLRQFYRDCDVYGTVDFIFGNAAAVFQNCNLYARVPLPGQSNVVTAQGRTMPEQATGISIHNCTVSAVPELGRAAKTFLGRPWKAYSRTVFMQSFIDGAVDPAGWLEWNGALAPSTIYYGEFQNYGTGADTAGRVKWPGFSLMNSDDALNFTLFNFTATDAWLSSTRIPYNSGLL